MAVIRLYTGKAAVIQLRMRKRHVIGLDSSHPLAREKQRKYPRTKGSYPPAHGKYDMSGAGKATVHLRWEKRRVLGTKSRHRWWPHDRIV